MSDDDFAAWQKKLYVWIIVAVVGGNAGTLLNALNPNMRSDSFTGADGALLERRIDTLEADLGVVIYRIDHGASREHDEIQKLRECCADLRKEH